MVEKSRCLFFSLIFGIFPVSTMAEPPPGVIEEANSSFIFVLGPDVSANDVPGLAKGLTRQYGGALRHTYTTVLKGFSATMSQQAAALMASHNPQILRYSRNGIAYAGSQPDKSGYNGNEPQLEGQLIPWGITRVGGPADGTGRYAWVLDTGIDLDNPDLNVDEEHGKNCVWRGKDKVDDSEGHGTGNAGIIAALNNDMDVVGVAAGATVIPVRVLHNNLYSYFDEMICGIDHVASTYASIDNNVAHHVINMSIYAIVEGQEAGVELLEQAIRNAIGQNNNNSHSPGLRFSVCAGNESDDASNYSPARMGSEYTNVYTVTAMNKNDQLYSQGNYGVSVDWAAPGVSITSLKAGGGLITWSGCSYAVPHVSGILLLGDDPVIDGFVNDGHGYAIPIATINGTSAPQ
ncbi:S8 family peptidase [Kaarinaea lacus]